MLLILCAAFLAIYLFYEFYWKRRAYPPGPIPFPLLGNLPQVLMKQPGYNAYLDWRETYGPVYTYWLSFHPMVAITSYDLLKKYIINQGEKFSDRFHFQSINDIFRGGNYGIIEADGELWRNQRRFAISTLRDFGMGKNIMEQRVLDEIEFMFENIEKSNRKTIIFNTFTEAIGNIINLVLLGYRFDASNIEELWKIRRRITAQQKEALNLRTFIVILLPFTRHLPFFNKNWKSFEDYRDELFGFFQNQIDIHRQQIDFESEESTDLLEVLLKEQRKHAAESDEGGFTNVQLRNVIFDIWVAGLETTVTTLTWGIKFLLNHPEVMEKMHEELDLHIEPGRKVEWSDRNTLHYCHAVVDEVQRFLNLVPQNLFRVAGEDMNIEGFEIKKGTIVIPQISCVLYDEKIFPNAQSFKPERFIDEDGKYKKYIELIPFSIGRRQCAGEGLARLELFLFFTNVMHKYKISADPIPSITKTFQSLMSPSEFEVQFEPRF